MWNRHGLAAILAVLASVGFVACGGSSTKAPGSFATAAAGATSTVGATGGGGAMSPGGATNLGDATSAAGATSAGGATSVGGVTIAGETQSAGGATGVGGPTSTGGVTSVGGATSTGGAGGSLAGGGSVATGGAIATGGTTSSTSGLTEGGYFVSGDWHGYAWTSAWPTGSTIAPSDFSADAVGLPFCATGTTAGESDNSGGAEIGCNINQARGLNTPVATWQPATVLSGGVLVNVSNPGNSTLRAQLTGPTGGTDANDRWCATIGAFGREILIPWTTFNTVCWNNSGSFYAGQPIQDVDVQVAGGTLAAAYDFCVNSIANVAVTTTPPVSCATPSTYGSCATGASCGTGACCASAYSYYCPQTNKCWATQEEAAANCGSTACSVCATPTNICPPSPGTGTCSNAGDLWCGGGVCCDSTHPYNCPATNLCYQTATAAAAACGGTACSTCKTTSACTKTCPVGQTLDALSCTCNSTCTNICPNGGTPTGPSCQCPQCVPSVCPGGGTPSAWPSCQCPQCVPSVCPGGGTPSAWPSCQCPQCVPSVCPGGGTPGAWPSCQCPQCATSFCPGGGTPSAWPSCTCPTPICTRMCPPGQFLNSITCSCS